MKKKKKKAVTTIAQLRQAVFPGILKSFVCGKCVSRRERERERQRRYRARLKQKRGVK